jgi:ferredoxin-NADP reductase/DMSO/TMAO reductase YedYZ heme-binding membrane subunit
MSTSVEAAVSAGPMRRPHDRRFAKLLVVVNGLVPGAILLWDAAHGQLGANGVNYALRTTGMLALVFLMLTLLVTPLRKLTGMAALIAYRRALGLFAFAYASTHFLIFFVFDRGLSLGSTLHEILNRRYLFIGASALLLMAPLAATSTNGMVMRLGARRWKRLHRLIYVVASAGVLHYYMLVKSDVRQPLVFAAVLAALLGFRAVRFALDRRAEAAAPPVIPARAAARRRFWSGELRVAEVRKETADVRTFRLVVPGASGQPLPFEHLPGQYLNLALTIDGRRVNRSYTIASPPTRREACEITVKRTTAGRGSAHLHDRIEVGSTVKVSAPAGRFVFTGAEAERVILIGGGVGVTPLMSILRALTDRGWPGQIHLVLASKTKADVIFAAELSDLAQRFPNLHVCHTLTRVSSSPSSPSSSRAPNEVGGAAAAAEDWTGERGRITRALLERVVPDLARGPVYLCGPDEMMTATRKLLLEMGRPESQLKTEAFVSPQPGTAAVAELGAEGDEAVADQLEVTAAPDGEGLASSARGGAGPTVVRVRFERSRQVVQDSSAKTILETAEESGIDIPFECRSGICGQCKTKLLSGRVMMEAEDALSAAEKARGLILACQAHALGEVVIDA